ncbi:MAG: DUF6044 family protein [Bacteroidota bacterium]
MIFAQIRQKKSAREKVDFLRSKPPLGSERPLNTYLYRWVAAALLLLQFLPYLILWDQAYIRIHDTLEGEWLWYHLLFENNLVFDSSGQAVIEQVMNGLPRRFLHSPWSMEILWISLFGIYGGYIFNYCLTHLLGFMGMYLLLQKHLLKDPRQEYISLGVALCFSWIPAFTVFGLSLLGLPLLIYCLLNIYRNQHQILSYFFILLFPFYSSVVWGGPAALLMGFGLAAYTYWKTAKWQMHLIWPCLILALGYLIADWPLFQFALDKGDFISQREEYNYFYNKELSWQFSLQEAFHLLFIGHYHVATLVSIPMLFSAFILLLRRGWSQRMMRIGAALAGILVFYGLYNWLVYWGGDYFPLLKSYKFNRIGILVPLFLFILFAQSLFELHSKQRIRRSILFLIAFQLINCIASNDEFLHNVRLISGNSSKPSFQAFYDTELFGEIKNFIGRPQKDYRVVSLGLHPAIAQYNGFYTLDAHQSLYSLSHKKQFRNIIARELDKNPLVKKEFDEFGNRCYLFSAELGKNEGIAFMQSRKIKGVVHQLDIETKPLYEMGGRYIFSAVEIRNSKDLKLKLRKVFEKPDSHWRIYLYQLVQ